MDLMSDMGLRAACLIDVTATLSADMIQSALDIAQLNPRTRAILINVLGGGFIRLDIVARGIAEYVRGGRLRLPMRVRVSGTFEDVASGTLREVGIEPSVNTLEAVKKLKEIVRGRGLKS